MIEKVVYFYEKRVRNVTALYYKIVLSALEKNNVEIIPVPECEKKYVNFPKSTYFYISGIKDFISLYRWGYRNFIFWFQGVEPEERYMFNHSKIKTYVFSLLEKMALKKSNYRIGVTEALFEHYRNKYKLDLPRDKYFIMPCFNTLLNPDSFKSQGKYKHNVFCYAGGLQPWQGVEHIFSIYEKIEAKYRDRVSIRIFSKELEGTKALLTHYQIKNYSIECVAEENMDKALAECKYGFIVREDNVVNNVAAPTKLSAYLANGVIPIFTSSIKAYKALSDQYSYLCCMDDMKDLQSIERIMSIDLSYDDILKEYSKIFDEYYNVDKYISNLSEYLSK